MCCYSHSFIGCKLGLRQSGIYRGRDCNGIAFTFKSEKQKLQEEVVETLTKIIDSIPLANFGNYCDTAIPPLQEILFHDYSSSRLLLRAKCLECIRIVFKAEQEHRSLIQVNVHGVMHSFTSLEGELRRTDYLTRDHIFKHVVDAFLDVGGVEKASVNTFHKLIRALCGTKSLKLGYFSTKMLLCPYFRFSEFSPFTSSGDHFSMFQLKFSEKCHVLQVLTISNWEEQKPLHLQSWAQPTRVPNCLRSHLTSFEFDGYRGLEDELEFAKYILRYGFVLKAMNISSHRSLDLSEKRDIHRHSLYDIRPGSSVCRFYFF
ncbi:uncharacterized protein LOC133307629 [Gastrolobium bilobum]|uniref:uncharacterized protein LOC133307629 n=1 Tax=Gastrolobium bilobum TaxID=150636 RepID=UPI002AAF1C93|nr:uncharacterized protein LOC133307629 [Gastrolobium bilobum]